MSWIFDPQVLQQIVRDSLGHPLDKMIARITGQLRERYPGHIQAHPEWVLNNAGGAMGQMLLLHASLTEYVIIFGSPVGTEGHSGRFHADDYFCILDGEQWAYDEGQLERSVYRPGDLHLMPRGTARGYRFPDRCYALEYARGNIPLMLPFGLADSFTSTMDAKTVWKTLKVYAKCVTSELLQGKI